MSKTDDTKIINGKPTEDFFCQAVEDSDDSTQISALLEWFENSIKKQMKDATETEFRRVVNTIRQKNLLTSKIKRWGGFSYLAQKSASEIDARVREKTLDLLEEYGFSKIGK